MNTHNDVVFDGTNYFLFATNYNRSSIVRLDFGTSPLNTPKSTDLGNVGNLLPPQLEGVSIVNDNGKWYGFVVGGLGGLKAKLVRLDFGDKLTNIPTAVDHGNVGNLDWPHGYRIVKDGTNWFGIAASRSNNSITIHDFGTSLSNTPSGSYYQIASHNSASNLMVVKDGDNWHVFVTCLFGPALVRLDYGNSLLNTPKEVDLASFDGVLGSLPRAVIILKTCDRYIGFIGTEKGQVVRLDFKNGIDTVPVAKDMGTIYGSHVIANFTAITFYGEVLMFSNNTRSQILRASIPICSGNVPSSNEFTPPAYSYSKARTYDVSLYVNAGHYNQGMQCDQVVVIDSLLSLLGADTTLCEGDSLLLEVQYKSGKYVWQDNSTGYRLVVHDPGEYWVSPVSGQCLEADTIMVDLQARPTIFGNDTILCSGDELTLDLNGLKGTYRWHDGSVDSIFLVSGAGEYWVEVTQGSCTTLDSISVHNFPVPLLFGSDTILCQEDTFGLKVDHVAGPYLWHNGSTDSLFQVTEAGEYWVTATDSNNCIHYDTIEVDYYVIPDLLGSDTMVCDKNGLLLTVNGGPFEAYQWGDGSEKKTFNARESGLVTVEVETDCGLIGDSIFISYDSCDCAIFFPNAFTPNANGLNETFRPHTKCTFIEYNLKVFNRWGEMIFETTDETEAWDGTFRGSTVQDGIYLCIFQYRTLQDRRPAVRTVPVQVMK